MRILSFLISTLMWSGIVLTARADLSVAAIFGNSMVLQRDRPVPVWGWATPGESVTVEFAGQTVTGKADATGKWQAVLKALPANTTPQAMKVGGIVFKDVLVGDVWLCSGQSQMGLELRKDFDAKTVIAQANHPSIRAFTVTAGTSTNQGYPIIPTAKAQRYALTPQAHCEGRWQTCTPAGAANWSAVAYSFARELHERLHVPIGIIVATYGATAIESWIGVEGLQAIPAYHERAVAFEELARAFVADTNSYPAALEAEKVRVAEKSKKWFAELDAEEPGLKKLSDWTPINLPVSPDDNPLGENPKAVWFRKEVAVPAEWVGKNLELQLGIVDGADEAYVNGTRVGRTWFDTPKYWNVSRVYPVTVMSTNVELALRVLKLAAPMGLFGPASNMVLAANGTSVSLTGTWRMAKSQNLESGRQPQPAPLLDRAPGNHYGHPGVQYNGQIQPLIPYAIRGVVWYQGGSNAPFFIDCRALLPGLIRAWREAWGQGDFPFGIVALPDYGPQQTKPVERLGRHLIREAQSMALSLTNTFLVTAVGTGEAANLHPTRMQEVGRRLALAAFGITGPTYKSMTIEDDKIRLQFDSAKGLHAESEPLVGFAIAGADRAFYFAKAKIEGEAVVVWSDKVPQPVAVRYAWATNPVCNLANGDNLPMFQFHTDNWDQSQLVIPQDTITIPAGWVSR